MGFVLERLRAALVQVAGYEVLPEGTFPTLPLLEATEFGQQHIITSFSLSRLPPAVATPDETIGLAVTLHIIMPQGYSYWQPETDSAQYIGGEQQLEKLPEVYARIPTAWVPHLAPRPYPLALLGPYLLLLEKVATNEWLLGKNADPVAEKGVALQINHYLRQLGEASPSTYYKARGLALRTWLARVTHEKSWVEEALAATWRTIPGWVSSSPQEAAALYTAEVIPAVLDERPCVVVAFYQKMLNPAGHALIYPPLAACYVSYPEMEIRWRPLQGVEHFALFLLPRDTNGRPYLNESHMPPNRLSRLAKNPNSYSQLVSLVLKNNWLRSHSLITAEEQTAALAMQEHFSILFDTPLSAYYQLEACQVSSWVRKVLSSDE